MINKDRKPNPCLHGMRYAIENAEDIVRPIYDHAFRKIVRRGRMKVEVI
jgi:hypothetical protein